MSELFGSAPRDSTAHAAGAEHSGQGRAAHYEPPTFQVISLDCEITSYAPDGDLPLF